MHKMARIFDDYEAPIAAEHNEYVVKDWIKQHYPLLEVLKVRKHWLSDDFHKDSYYEIDWKNGPSDHSNFKYMRVRALTFEESVKAAADG